MCQRLVCQKREFAVRSYSCEVYDLKFYGQSNIIQFNVSS